MKKDERSIVVILGAGASKILGFPLQSEIWNFLNDGCDDFDICLINRLRLRLGDNIEQIFTYLEAGIRNKDINVVYEDIPSANLENLQNLILDQFSRVKLKESGVRTYTLLINKLLCFKQVTFINLNWDVGLENIIRNLKVGVNYGILFDYDHDAKDYDYKDTIFLNEPIKTFSVLKPHGSLNWSFCPACKRLYCHRYYYYPNHVMFASGKLEKEMVKIIDCQNCSSYHVLPSNLRRIFIAPSIYKKAYLNYFDSIGRRTHQAISEANIIIFIGYSFRETDWDVKYILYSALNGLGESKLENIFILDNQVTTKRIEDFFEMEKDSGVKIKKIGYLNKNNLYKLFKFLNI